MSELRVDPYTGTAVHVVEARQDRPNLPSTGCPFCVGGLEAPEPYDVFWFPNRWPAMGDDRCEVVLYTSQHDATFWSLGVDGIRKVIDLWADRTTALGARDDVDFVLVFENRGRRGRRDDRPPARADLRLRPRSRPPVAAARGVVAAGTATPAIVPSRRLPAGPPTSRGRRSFPVELQIAPIERVPDLPTLGDAGRDEMAHLLVDVFERLDRLYERPLPYMMWLNQRPTTGDRLRRRVVQHRARVALARPGRAAVHRRRRGGEQRVLQPG